MAESNLKPAPHKQYITKHMTAGQRVQFIAALRKYLPSHVHHQLVDPYPEIKETPLCAVYDGASHRTSYSNFFFSRPADYNHYLAMGYELVKPSEMLKTIIEQYRDDAGIPTGGKSIADKIAAKKKEIQKKAKKEKGKRGIIDNPNQTTLGIPRVR